MCMNDTASSACCIYLGGDLSSVPHQLPSEHYDRSPVITSWPKVIYKDTHTYVHTQNMTTQYIIQ